MSDELDPGLRRLFAATADSPADEAFVAEVTVKTARERRLVVLRRTLAGVAALAAFLAAMAAGGQRALGREAAEIASLVGASPVGWATGLALVFAGVVCVRALAPLLSRGRS